MLYLFLFWGKIFVDVKELCCLSVGVDYFFWYEVFGGLDKISCEGGVFGCRLVVFVGLVF